MSVPNSLECKATSLTSWFKIGLKLQQNRRLQLLPRTNTAHGNSILQYTFNISNSQEFLYVQPCKYFNVPHQMLFIDMGLRFGTAVFLEAGIRDNRKVLPPSTT